MAKKKNSLVTAAAKQALKIAQHRRRKELFARRAWSKYQARYVAWNLCSERVADLVQDGPVPLVHLGVMFSDFYGPDTPNHLNDTDFIEALTQRFLPDITCYHDGDVLIVSRSDIVYAVPYTGRDPCRETRSTGGPSHDSMISGGRSAALQSGQLGAPSTGGSSHETMMHAEGNAVLEHRRLVTNEKYVLVTDRASFERGLETVCKGARTLDGAISGTVALDLEGLNLGAARGTLSLIQVGLYTMIPLLPLYIGCWWWRVGRLLSITMTWPGWCPIATKTVMGTQLFPTAGFIAPFAQETCRMDAGINAACGVVQYTYTAQHNTAKCNCTEQSCNYCSIIVQRLSHTSERKRAYLPL